MLSIFILTRNGYSGILLYKVKLYSLCNPSNEEERLKCAKRIYFDPNLPRFNQTKQEIKEFLEVFRRYGAIDFIESSERNADIHIKMVKNKLSHANAGASLGKVDLAIFEGHFAGGHLDNYEERRGTVLHEMMHILGFAHEHRHPERWVNFSSDNIERFCEKMRSDLRSRGGSRGYVNEQVRKNCYGELENPFQRNEIEFKTTYDFESVMHMRLPTQYRDRSGNRRLFNWGAKYFYTSRNRLSLYDKFILAQVYEGRVNPSLITIRRMHEEDERIERRRFEKTLTLNRCTIKKVENATETNYWGIFIDGDLIPETVKVTRLGNGRTRTTRTIWQKDNISGAKMKMRTSRSCRY